MAGRECYHCKEWIEQGEAHDCWTTTEGALTADLPDEVREAWERIRETAIDFGEQRIYASGTAIRWRGRSLIGCARPTNCQTSWRGSRGENPRRRDRRRSSGLDARNAPSHQDRCRT